MPTNTNRFELLAENTEDLSSEPTEIVKKKPKPPLIFIREKSSSALVNQLVDLTGKNNFHITSLVKGTIHKIKVQTKTEDNYRELTKYLNDKHKNYFTYHLKSSKVATSYKLQVVLKGIEPEVTPEEITEALQEKGFSAKSVFNIINKDKKPQPLFKVELEPETKSLKRYEIHQIYKLQFLLHRRITVEEPHKCKTPVQCTNSKNMATPGLTVHWALYA